MRYLLLSKDELLAEFDFYASTDTQHNINTKKYAIENVDLKKPSSFRSLFMIGAMFDENSNKRRTGNDISEVLLGWISSRQIAYNRPGANEVYASYDNNLVNFVNRSLCLSEDDQLWIVEKVKYLRKQNKYVFDNLRNTAEVKQYEAMIFEKTLGISADLLQDVENISDREAKKRYLRTLGESFESLSLTDTEQISFSKIIDDFNLSDEKKSKLKNFLSQSTKAVELIRSIMEVEFLNQCKNFEISKELLDKAEKSKFALNSIVQPIKCNLVDVDDARDFQNLEEILEKSLKLCEKKVSKMSF